MQVLLDLFIRPVSKVTTNHVEPVWNPQGFVTARESVTVTQVSLNKRTATRNAENADNFPGGMQRTSEDKTSAIGQCELDGNKQGHKRDESWLQQVD